MVCRGIGSLLDTRDARSVRGSRSLRESGRTFRVERTAVGSCTLARLRDSQRTVRRGIYAMKTNKIDHICIAVRNLEAARKIWEPVLGKSAPDDSYVDEPEKIRVARYWIGGIGFELMESLSPEGDVAKFIERRGEGVMLISLNVDNTRESVSELTAQDYPIIGGIRPFRDCEFAFVHPRKMNGVLLEVIDYKWRELEGRENTPCTR